MAHNLTETATFAPTVTVPDGTDDHHGLAEAVESIAQTLANRTQALKADVDIAAKINGPVTFAGSVTAQGDLLATNNATIGTDGTGNLTVNGDVSVKNSVNVGTDGTGDVNVTGNVNVGTDGVGFVAINGPMTAHGNVTGDQFVYNNVQPRTITLDLSSGAIRPATEIEDYVALAANQRVSFAIPVPHGAILKTAQVKFSTAGCIYLIRTFRRHGVNMTDVSLPNNQEIASTGLVASGLATVNISLSYSDLIASSLESYSLSILNDGASVNEMRVYAMRVTYEQSTLTNAGSF